MLDSLFRRNRGGVSDKVIYVDDNNKNVFSCFDDMMVNKNFGYYSIPEVGQSINLIKNYLIVNLEYSVYYRKMIRENDTDTIVRLLMKESSLLEKSVNMDMFRTCINNLKENMAPFDIIRIPADSLIAIEGNTYRGAKGLKEAWHHPGKKVQNRWEGFPCFDSYDYANENRCYNNYCFCSEKSETWRTVSEMEVLDSDFCLIGEKMPGEVLPMVYVNDVKTTILIARHES